MKKLINRLFDFTTLENKYLNSDQNKIELVSCKFKDLKCEKIIPVINENYARAAILRQEKDFQRSIESLKFAYFKTLEINQSHCLKCAAFFRSIIINSLENIYSELERLSSRGYNKKYFHASFIKAELALQEIKGFDDKMQMKIANDKKHYLNQYPQKHVS